MGSQQQHQQQPHPRGMGRAHKRKNKTNSWPLRDLQIAYIVIDIRANVTQRQWRTPKTMPHSAHIYRHCRHSAKHSFSVSFFSVFHFLSLFWDFSLNFEFCQWIWHALRMCWTTGKWLCTQQQWDGPVIKCNTHTHTQILDLYSHKSLSPRTFRLSALICFIHSQNCNWEICGVECVRAAACQNKIARTTPIYVRLAKSESNRIETLLWFTIVTSKVSVFFLLSVGTSVCHDQDCSWFLWFFLAVDDSRTKVNNHRKLSKVEKFDRNKIWNRQRRQTKRWTDESENERFDIHI